VTAKSEAFRALHAGDPFIIPNPWDAGSAKVLAALGFKALATTSSAFAFTLGRPDGGVTLEEVVAHTRALDEATPLPVSVDLENGYGAAPEDAARAVSAVRAAGAAGGSIEDYDPETGIYDRGHAVERIAAAVEAAGGELVLTARAENLIRGVDDLDDTIARLQAYEGAGADVLYAPGLRNADQVRAVCSAVGKPVNVLAHGGLTMAEIAEAGGQRVSVGGALGWAAVHAFAEAAVKMRDEGDFSGLRGGRRVAEWLRGARG
jgi:2-methylisocitrate lyase-like PEP mutase family enzyme